MSSVHFRLGMRGLVIALLPLFFIQCNALKPLEKPSASRSARTNKPSGPSARQEALRQDVVAYAKKYQGKNYQAAGKTPSTGFDCSGFTSYVWDHFDVQLSPSSSAQAKQGREKPVRDAKPGDLIFFRRGPDQPIFHVALVYSNDGKSLKVIHSTSSRGVVIDDVLASTYWKPKIDSVREVIRK